MQLRFMIVGYIMFIIYFTIRQLCFNFKANLNTPPFRWRLHKKTLQAISSDLMVVAGISCFLDRTGISLGVIGVLLDAIMFADLLYMRYYKNPLTVSVIKHNIHVMREAKESVFTVLNAKDFLYFVDIPILILYTISMYSVVGLCTVKDRCYFGGVLVIIGSLWLSIVYHYSNREPYTWNRKRIARDLGILFFHIADILREILGKLKCMKHLPEDKVEDVKKMFIKCAENQYTGCCKDSSFILIQMESMQDYLIDMKINGCEVTPNLNRLMKENIRFSNMYYQTSVANTADAELLSNNSLYPSAEKPSCYKYQNNQFFALGDRLKKAGYTVKGFHGNQASTWNRHLVYRQYGYQSFKDNSDMLNDEVYYLGLGDSSFFRQVIEREGNSLESGKAFLFLITLSQHHPFKHFADYDFQVAEYEGSMFGNYLKAANYADKALGELINDLKKRNIYDSSLIFMYGDHSGIPELYWNQNTLKERIPDMNDNEWLRSQKVAACLHLPEEAQKKINVDIPVSIQKVVGQVDILPTICNLFSLDDRCLLGEDMLNENPDAVAILRDGTVIGQHFIHYTGEDFVYDNLNKKISINEKTRNMIREAEKKLGASDLILEYNLMKCFLVQ